MSKNTDPTNKGMIRFITKIANTGRINIPTDKLRELDKKVDYYEVIVIPIEYSKVS